MKIIQFLDIESTKFGALDSFIIDLAESMPQHKFYIIYNNTPTSEPLLTAAKKAKVELIAIDTSGKKAIQKIPSVAKMFYKIKPDIIHFHFAHGFFMYAPIAKLLGVKKLYKTQHCCLTTNDMQQIHRKSEFSLKTKLISLNGLTYKLFTKVIMCGKYIKEQFEEVYGKSDKNETIYFGVKEIKPLSLEEKKALKEQLHIPANNTVISTIAFANPIKGVDILINSLTHIEKKDYTLMIVGLGEQYEYTQNLQQLATALGVNNNIRWIGITNNVGQYLSISDVYCQPSRSEALTLAVCEAKSIHLPVIASNIGGLPELTNITFTVEDDKELATHLAQFIGNKELCLAEGEKSYQDYCKLFSIDKGLRKYQDLYK